MSDVSVLLVALLSTITFWRSLSNSIFISFPNALTVIGKTPPLSNDASTSRHNSIPEAFSAKPLSHLSNIQVSCFHKNASECFTKLELIALYAVAPESPSYQGESYLSKMYQASYILFLLKSSCYHIEDVLSPLTSINRSIVRRILCFGL